MASSSMATVMMAVTPAQRPSRPSSRFSEFVAPSTKKVTMKHVEDDLEVLAGMGSPSGPATC